VARKPRIEQPGGIYHVTTRGNNKSAIYCDEPDRLTFLRMLGRVTRRYRWLVYAYCLMTNHYHLVLQLLEGGLSRGLCELNGGYSRQTNKRHGRQDHLFGRRFAGIPVETEAHLFESCRYVVMNPVRAGLCDSPEDWRWSSYRACAGLESPPTFLAAQELLQLFAPNPDTAARSYRADVTSE
jgi:putative transposase